MNIKHIKLFIDNRNHDCEVPVINGDLKLSYQEKIKSNDYFYFMEEVKNGGFYFKQSLQLYVLSPDTNFMSIDFMNNTLKQEYGSLFKNIIAFGQDVFGNQFIFDLDTQQILFFNCETGEKELLANSFDEWLNLFINDINYYTGESLLEKWMISHLFKFDQRLCPKQPFVLRGSYDIENFVASSFPKYIKYYSDLAKQIYNLKDGEEVSLILSNPE